MALRKDVRIVDYLNVDKFRSRKEVRKFLLVKYALEDCHKKTRYFVEKFDNCKQIYIERPTSLNKGCDFILYAEDVIVWKNGNDRPPSHNDVITDITTKKRKLTSTEYAKLLQAIKCIYDLEPYSVAESHINNLQNFGWSYELLLKLLRWLFIEQDITYWAGDGRKRLYDEILKVV